MLKADGQQSLRFKCERVAILVEGPDFDPFGAWHGLIHRRNRQAALFDVRHAGRFDDLRIDHDDQRIMPVGSIDDDHPLVYIDLRRGKADTWRGIHGFRHVAHQPLQFGVKHRNRGSNFVKPRIRIP